MALYLHYRQVPSLPEVEELAAWESAPCLVFASAEALQAEADAQGLAELMYAGGQALFPACQPGTAHLTADDEELIWELACEQSADPENAEAWLPGVSLLPFLTFWRLALLDDDAYLELVAG